MNSTLYLNFNKLSCRVCLRNYDETNSFYDVVEFEEPINLKDLLQRVTNIEILPNVKPYPTRLCSNCTGKLIISYEFIRAVEKAEQILLDCVLAEPQSTSVLVGNKDGLVITPYEIYEDRHQDLEILDEEFLSAEPFEQDIIKEEALADSVSDTLFSIEEIDDDDEISEDTFHKKKEKTFSLMKRSKHGMKIGTRLVRDKKDNWSQCTKCYRSFAKLTSLSNHMKAAHTPASPEKILANAPKPTIRYPLQCRHCLRTFTRKDNLQRHMVAIHPDVAEDPLCEQDPTKKIKYKRGVCPHCGDTFPAASLIVHIRRHTGEKPYTCDECGKGFPRRQDLHIHSLQHTGERPHICTVCGKTFSRINKLTRHMRIHTGDRPYKCEECGKGFTQSNDLKIHMRRHTGEKPYVCTVCNQGFICGTALKTHRKLLSHYTLDDEVIDPYANCRVNNKRAEQMAQVSKQVEDFEIKHMHDGIDDVDVVKIEDD